MRPQVSNLLYAAGADSLVDLVDADGCRSP